jgi:tetratricopeptide (TPR) repeat protein
MTAGESADSNKAFSEAARHLQEGNLGKASEIASGVLAVLPGDADANYIYARCLIETGDLERALAHLEKAISTQSSFTEAHCAVGMLNQMIGRNDAALAAFTKTLELYPSHLQANMSLGLLYCNWGKFPQALALVEKVISTQQRSCRGSFCARGVPAWRR